jgi:hypothetical protein
MEIIFTKGSGKFDVMEVMLPGKPVERLDCPKQRIIPHDMVHFAVEHTLKVHGFLGRVKDGEVAAFGMKPEARSDAVRAVGTLFRLAVR